MIEGEKEEAGAEQSRGSSDVFCRVSSSPATPAESKVCICLRHASACDMRRVQVCCRLRPCRVDMEIRRGALALRHHSVVFYAVPVVSRSVMSAARGVPIHGVALVS